MISAIALQLNDIVRYDSQVVMRPPQSVGGRHDGQVCRRCKVAITCRQKEL